MRILVFSDSHTSISSCCSLVEKISGTDMIIHAGDHASDAEKLKIKFPDIDVVYVRGNCDFTAADDELVKDVCGKRIFLTHGHRYNVKFDSDYRLLRKRAEEQNADIAVFGHTHIPFHENNGKLILMNPGSIKYTHTFGIIEIEDSKLRADICDADAWL